MLQGAKGIPAWRAPLFAAADRGHGARRGRGLFFLLAPLHGNGRQSLLVLFGALLLVRVVVWLAYRRRLATALRRGRMRALDARRPDAAARGNARAARVSLRHWRGAVSGTQVVLSRRSPGSQRQRPARTVKYALVTRAAFNQGFALRAPAGARHASLNDNANKSRRPGWAQRQWRKWASRPGNRSPVLPARIETMPREQLAALQLERLRATVRNAYENVSLHRRTARRGGYARRATSRASPISRACRSREGRSARPLSVRPVRAALGRTRAPARIVAARPASRPSSATRATTSIPGRT